MDYEIDEDEVILYEGSAEYVVDDKNYEEDNSGTVKAITEKIEELGYTVVPNYGYSAFKVDMAIKKDEDFVLAIMIDGKSKYSGMEVL